MSKYETSAGYKERFEAKFKVGDKDECWPWLAGRESRGYGTFKVNGKMKKAHRMSYELYKGPLSEGLMVLHSCDNHQCVNPSHLFLGTAKNNTQDMMQKGRHWGGHKLNDLIVAEIKRMLIDAFSIDEIALTFNVNRSTIERINRGDTWSHVHVEI